MLLERDNMKDTLTINGKLYVHTPEVKEDRLSGWIWSVNLRQGKTVGISPAKGFFDDTRMVELKENEVITTKEAIIKACIESYGEMIDPDEFFKGWL